LQEQPIAPALTWSEFVVVRLLRRWAAARANQDNSLPALVELAADLGEPTETAIALHSLFQLTEACLERPLEAECCCSRTLSRDERAVLTLLAKAPGRAPPLSSVDVPHGLPGALLWAAATVRTLLGPARSTAAWRPTRCPFEPVNGPDAQLQSP
jgi:hypothetical protein